MSTQRRLLVAGVALVAMMVPLAASAAPPAAEPEEPELLATLDGGAGSGSAIGPGGALYVAQPAAGEIWRIDPASGEKTLYASGLPQKFQALPFGGVMDVAFIGSTAYALVSVVGADPANLSDLLACNGQTTIGIYRVDGPTSSTVVADIGDFSCDNPPSGFPFLVPTGVQYALETYRGGFLVTDGHHNRVLRVTLDGTITQSIGFAEDVVPTGLSVKGNTIYMAEAGPVPHSSEDGRIVSFEPGSSTVSVVAAGAPLLVDVERGRGQTLFALAQGHFSCDDPECAGAPADPDTGALVMANANGTFTTLADQLDRPTSLEIIGTTAYIVTLGGEIWTVDDISGPPYG